MEAGPDDSEVENHEEPPAVRGRVEHADGNVDDPLWAWRSILSTIIAAF